MTVCLLTLNVAQLKINNCLDAFYFEKRKTQLKKILPVVLIAIALFTFGLCRPAFADVTGNGAKIFSAN